MTRLPRLKLPRLLPKTLVSRVYTLYAVTLLLFVGVGLGLFYKYQFTREVEETQESAATLAQVIAQTVSDSAVIGDYDTIKKSLERAVRNSRFASGAFIEVGGTIVKASNVEVPNATPPAWLRHRIAEQLFDINLPVNVGGRDYGVLRFTFDVEVVAGDIWNLTRFAALLAAIGLVGGLLVIRFPLRRWLGTLERVQEFERDLRAGKIDASKALEGDVPAELRATFDVLSRTARTLREQLDARDNALKSLRGVVRELLPEVGDSPANAIAGRQDATDARNGPSAGIGSGGPDDIEVLSSLIGRLVAEREAGRRELDNQKFALDQHAIVMIFDRQDRTTYVNDKFCHLLGFTREELTGRNNTHIHTGSNPPALYRAMREAIYNGRVWQGEMCSPTKTGTLKWLATTIVPLKRPDGSVDEFISISTDITQRREAEAALQKATAIAEAANRAKSDFLANMSHEIRTPMNAVIGMTRLALDTEDRDEQREYMHTVRSSANSLLSIINDILDFSKIEAGKLDMESIPFSVRGTLGEALKGLATRAHEKSLELVLDVAADVPEMLVGDPGRLRQVIVNLAGNAVKFTEHGEVVLRVTVAGTGKAPAGPGRTGNLLVRFAVADTGIGIPPDKRDTVFESFMQEDTSTTRRYGGTGLGLAISSRLVGMMGGRIELDSEVGRGSTFSFAIELGVAPDVARVSAGELAGRRALIVDDNAANRAVLTGMLAGWNMHVRDVSGGPAAIRSLASEPADIVLLDARMPDMDGFETAAIILRDHPTARMAMISSIGLRGDSERCRAVGITGYLTKPVDRDDLLAMMKRMLGTPSTERDTLVTRHLLRDEREQDAARATSAAPLPEVKSGTDANTAAKPLQAGIAPAHLDVLLVEDHPVNRLLATKLLERWGHRVTHAEDGRQGLERMRSHRFDLVLMDLQMPVMGGLEATRLWREGETGGHLPIIAMTASAMVSDHDACIAAGMDDYIAKPFDQDVLKRMLEGYASRSWPARDAGQAAPAA